MMDVAPAASRKNSATLEMDDNGFAPDVYVGAFLMTHLQAKCENCNTVETPQWRKGWYSDLLHHNVLLCNACGLKYNKNQYCPYCMFIYYKEEDKKSEDTWVACDDCQRWVHIQCEINCGGTKAKDFTPFNAYHCPSCRARPAPKAKSHHHYHSSSSSSTAAASSTNASSSRDRHASHRRGSSTPEPDAQEALVNMMSIGTIAPDGMDVEMGPTAPSGVAGAAPKVWDDYHTSQAKLASFADSILSTLAEN